MVYNVLMEFVVETIRSSVLVSIVFFQHGYKTIGKKQVLLFQSL